MRYAKWLIVLLVVILGSAVIFYKPVRILFPESFGMTCNDNKVCVDDPAHLDAAVILLSSARTHLEVQYGLSGSKPRIIFCRSKDCQTTFGLSKKAGYTLHTIGIVIAPRGWRQHYVAHELIHYWQAENFGWLVLLNGEPWVLEGMAYALSDDPREELHEPFESYRQKFREWYHMNASIPLKQSVGTVL